MACVLQAECNFLHSLPQVSLTSGDGGCVNFSLTLMLAYPYWVGS